MGVRVISAWNVDSHFLDAMYKRFIPTQTFDSHFLDSHFDSHFLDTMYLEFMKIFFSLIRANWLVSESFRPPEPKNDWFPLSRHDVLQVH